MEKERQEKRTKWQRGTRGGNREKIDATREIKWETRKTRGNYFLFLYLKKKSPQTGISFCALSSLKY